MRKIREWLNKRRRQQWLQKVVDVQIKRKNFLMRLKSIVGGLSDEKAHQILEEMERCGLS